MGFFDLINPFSYVTPVHADEGETEKKASEVEIVASDPVEEESTEEETEVEEEEEEIEVEEEEAVDPSEAIMRECGETLHCRSLKHLLDECTARVEADANESCVEELLHFMHCVDKCAVPQIFAKLK
ncbi:ubiquinol--cytochrome-c reductase subunit 6 [Coemansia sp. BCRC 34962]|nr:ubiquinol--cytochrome-c reductase subunit 6 [Coemansia sp. BCRC 34962]